MSEYEDLDTQLRAWLGEDEQLAQWAASTRSGSPGGHWKTGCSCDGECREHGDCERVEGDNITIYDEGGHDADQARHIARHDPATVLADIAGKRALLDHVAGWGHELVDGDWWFSCSQAALPDEDEPGSGCADEKRKGKPCDCGLDKRRLAVLRCVAAGYMERDGFKAEWRIDG